MREHVPEPLRRSALRTWLGMAYYGLRRRLFWLKMRRRFARLGSEVENGAGTKPLPKAKSEAEIKYGTDPAASADFGRAEKPTACADPAASAGSAAGAFRQLPFSYYRHETILLRRLKDVDMWLQYNKVKNLKIAASRMDGLMLRPGEIFSYWRLIGKPTKRKGYAEGMVLHNGTFHAGTGGGLCQLSNLIFWMTVHTPLTVIERHRHGYDVFPDSNRTQPFGSGATCFYPHGDLMIRNDTEDDYQLRIFVGEKYLEGEWRVSAPPQYRFEVVEREHRMQCEFWGGYTRHNELWQQVYDREGTLLDERMIVKNAAVMMYEPFLDEQPRDTTQDQGT